MEQYVALDVSLQKIAVCVLNASGRVVIEAEVASEPGVLISFIRTKAPHAVRIGLESGPTSPWLWHSLKSAGLPVVCMDARHAHAALSVRPTKSDRNDARGLAEMVRMGWYKEVQVKSLAAHERMALLGVRRRLVDMRVEIDGQRRLARLERRAACEEAGAIGYGGGSQQVGPDTLGDDEDRRMLPNRDVCEGVRKDTPPQGTFTREEIAVSSLASATRRDERHGRHRRSGTTRHSSRAQSSRI